MPTESRAEKPKKRPRPRARAPLRFDDVREVGLTLPDVEAARYWGGPSLKVHNRLMTCPATNKSAEPGSIIVCLSFEDRDRLMKEQPDVYYIADHYVKYPCVLARLSALRKAALRELLGTAWRFAMERAPPTKKKRR